MTDGSADSKSDAQPEAQGIDQAEGLSPCISCEIPRSLSEESWSRDEDEDETATEEDSLFYHALGVCADVVGFDAIGRLLLASE